MQGIRLLLHLHVIFLFEQAVVQLVVGRELANVDLPQCVQGLTRLLLRATNCICRQVFPLLCVAAVSQLRSPRRILPHAAFPFLIEQVVQTFGFRRLRESGRTGDQQHKDGQRAGDTFHGTVRL